MDTHDTKNKEQHRGATTGSESGKDSLKAKKKGSLHGTGDNTAEGQNRKQFKKIQPTPDPESLNLFQRIWALSTTAKAFVVAIAAASVWALGVVDAIYNSSTAKAIWSWYQNVPPPSELEQNLKLLEYYAEFGSENHAKEQFRSMTNKYGIEVIKSFLNKSENDKIRQRLEEMGVLNNAKKD
jgi:hypothetical protein